MSSCVACTSGHSSHSSLSKAVWFHGCGTLRCGQALSGTLRYSLERSASISIQPSTSVLTATTVSSAMTASRATDTLDCFTGLQQPQRPRRPQAPKEPQQPQGWMPSFDSRLPIPMLSVKSPFFECLVRILDFFDFTYTFLSAFQKKTKKRTFQFMAESWDEMLAYIDFLTDGRWHVEMMDKT